MEKIIKELTKIQCEIGIDNKFANKYKEGFLDGLEKAIEILKATKTTKRLFYDIEEDKIINEKELRLLLFNFEVQDLENNNIDYLDNFLSLESQFNCIEIAKNGTIEEVIDRLGTCWNIPIKEINLKNIK